MGYGILRVEKIKKSDGGGLVGRAKHSFREFTGAMTMESMRNEYIGARTHKELRTAAAERWATLTGKPRSDAVGVLEVVVTTTAGELKKTDERQFFEDVRKEVSNWYGAENVLAMAIHRDETTPHCHIFVTPIEKKRQRKKHLSAAEKQNPESVPVFDVVSLNAKKIMGGKQKLSQLQTIFHEHVFKKYGLERGESAEKTHRVNQRPTLRYDVAKLAEQKKQLENERVSIEKKIQQEEEVTAAVIQMLEDNRLSEMSESKQLFDALKSMAKKTFKLMQRVRELEKFELPGLRA